MCGIIGYIGKKPAQNVILEGLRRLEYRGYDSSGLCIIKTKGAFELRKKSGRLNDLAAVLAKQPAKGDTGIGGDGESQLRGLRIAFVFYRRRLLLYPGLADCQLTR